MKPGGTCRQKTGKKQNAGSDQQLLRHSEGIEGCNKFRYDLLRGKIIRYLD
jgi:hypothetical protein